MVAAVNEVPVSTRHETPQRWERALARAIRFQLSARELEPGRWAVASISQPGIEHVTDGLTCDCQAGQHGDPVCAHRAIARRELERRYPAPGSCGHDALTEAIRWARNDLERAWRDLDRYNAILARVGRLSVGEEAGFHSAQRRELEAHDRLSAAKEALAAAEAAWERIA